MSEDKWVYGLPIHYNRNPHTENCDERNQRVPPCGKCTHLFETKISNVCSTLECDLPNGNRKASRDVGGCEHFTPRQKGEDG